MSKIRSKNTNPEIITRKLLYSKGIRYRCNVKGLPGKPDIAIKKYKLIIQRENLWCFIFKTTRNKCNIVFLSLLVFEDCVLLYNKDE